MTGDPLKPLRPGGEFPLSARTWNPVLELVRTRTLAIPSGGGQDRGAFQIVVRNDSGTDLARQAPVTLNGSVVLADDGLLQFREQPVLIAEKPAEDHLDKLVVTSEPIADGAFGRATVSGVVVIQVDLGTGNTHAKPIIDDVTKLQGGTTGHLILYRPGANGVQWCVIALGNRLNASGAVFAVTMSQTGGSDGTPSATASWSYTVTDAITGATLGTVVNPASSPHKWRRPDVGKMLVATFGHAHFNGDELVIGWCNETINASGC